MIDNALRCIESDYPTMVGFAELLGVITVIDGNIEASPQCIWDFIGYKYLEDNAVLMDGNGNKYVHVNVRTPFSVGEAAATLAAGNPDIAAALQNAGRFFILDEQGNPNMPEFPLRIFS